jgi:type IV secretion system protein VirD4
MSSVQRRTISRPQQSGWAVVAGWDATSLLLMAGAAVLGVATVLWSGAVLATFASGRHDLPDGGLLPSVRALGRVGDPAAVWPHPGQLPNAAWYWSVTVFLVAFVVGAGTAAKVTLGAHGACDEVDRIRALPGLATPREADKVSGQQALVARAPVIRPSHATTTNPRDLGYRIGSTQSRSLWCAVEDSALLIGPPRMGKGVHIVIPWVLDAPGPVVVTSTRPDTLAVTYKARERSGGPVAIFDPQGLAGRPGGLKWSPVRGCDRPRTALVRARGLAAGTGFGTTSDGDFWQGQTETPWMGGARSTCTGGH